MDIDNLECTCVRQNTASGSNPKGHAVECPRYGTVLPLELKLPAPPKPGSFTNIISRASVQARM